MALETVAVLGGGAWGTALAQAAAMAGRSVTLVLRSAEQAAAINATHINQAALPGQLLLPSITASTTPVAADIFILAVPAQATRTLLTSLDADLLAGKSVVLRGAIENVANKKYWLTQGTYVGVGSPRTVVVSASVDL